MHRRAFIGAAFWTLVSAPSAGATMAASDPERQPLPRLHAAVWDSRFPASHAFAVAAADLGAPVRETNGDLTSLWFNDLDRAWVEHGAAVVGCTTLKALFCLEQLARDRRMRVLFRATHEPFPDGRTRHVMVGSDASVIRAGALLDDGASPWPSTLADVVIHETASPSAGARSVIRESSRETPLTEPLTTWIIARPTPAKR